MRVIRSTRKKGGNIGSNGVKRSQRHAEYIHREEQHELGTIRVLLFCIGWATVRFLSLSPHLMHLQVYCRMLFGSQLRLLRADKLGRR